MEKPVFVHPEEDDPEDYIGFRSEHPYGRDDLGRGKATIEALALDRPELEEQRRKRLAEAERTQRVAVVLRRLKTRDGRLAPDLQKLATEHEAALLEYQDASVEYRAMLKASGIVG